MGHALWTHYYDECAYVDGGTHWKDVVIGLPETQGTGTGYEMASYGGPYLLTAIVDRLLVIKAMDRNWEI